MGILGAALATDISQAVSGVISFVYLCRKFSVLAMEPGEHARTKEHASFVGDRTAHGTPVQYHRHRQCYYAVGGEHVGAVWRWLL